VTQQGHIVKHLSSIKRTTSCYGTMMGIDILTMQANECPVFNISIPVPRYAFILVKWPGQIKLTYKFIDVHSVLLSVTSIN